MPTVDCMFGRTQSLIKRAIDLVRESEELVQDIKNLAAFVRRICNLGKNSYEKSCRLFLFL